jgi:hypothetical protein
MSKKPNLKNQEKLRIYLQSNDIQSDNTANKATSQQPQADKKLLQGASNRLPNR